jgi:hypothetical protein
MKPTETTVIVAMERAVMARHIVFRCHCVGSSGEFIPQGTSSFPAFAAIQKYPARVSY